MSTTIVHEVIARKRRNKQYNDICWAIARADEPPSRRDLEYMTHRPESQVRRLLSDLRENGTIRRYRDPDDNRVYRYVLAGGAE